MMRRWWLLAAACFLITGASPARADSLKEAIYVLGVHIGNANGALYGLNNSYDKYVKAHPGAIPLLNRQIAFTSALAAALGLETSYLTRLESDLPRLSFAQMATRFDAATERLEKEVSQKYKKNSGAVFRLGAVTAKTGGVVKLVASLLPKDQEAPRPAISAWASYTTSTLVELQLDTTEGIDAGPAQELARRALRGPLTETIAAADLAVSTWQSEFEAAPAWKFGAKAQAPPQVNNQPPAKQLPVSAFAQQPSKGNNTTPGASTSRPSHSSAAAGKSFAGRWSTNWGDMTLSGNGSQVSGSYAHSDGSLTGTVTGNVLRFRWAQKGNGNKGSGKFTLSADGRSFSGSWNYEDDPEKPGNSWTGQRK